ncbi:MAG: hypothetical protein M5U34_46330 [Chloroflexi bacterium]|nr:hypothetical protein [Chloroflexota bacterium]
MAVDFNHARSTVRWRQIPIALDYDTGLPPYEEDKTAESDLENGRHRLRSRIHGVSLEWEDEPFEWVAPYHFGVVRHYQPGPLRPIAQLRVAAQLQPTAEGGSRLTLMKCGPNHLACSGIWRYRCRLASSPAGTLAACFNGMMRWCKPG